MKFGQIAGYASMVLLSACLSTPGSETGRLARTSAAEVPQECRNAQSLAESVKFIPLDLAQVQGTWSRAPGVDPRWLKLLEANLLSGECADLLDSFLPSQLYFSTSTVVRLTTEGVKVVDPPERTSDIEATDPHPQWKQGKFVMAVRVTYYTAPKGRISTYIGLWNTGNGAVLGRFQQRAEHGFGEVRPLLVSGLPVRGINYAPSPHAGTGRISLVQEGSNGPRLLNLFWAHGRM